MVAIPHFKTHQATPQRGLRLFWNILGRKSPFFSLQTFNSHNTETLELHLPGCEFYTPPQKVRKVKARFTYLGYILSTTISATISIATGAGGLSISPSLSISRVVPNDSCAFAQVSWERFGKFVAGYPRESVAKRHQLLENTREQLLRMFSERQASPKDLNEWGQSLFHVNDPVLVLSNFALRILTIYSRLY
jgi:hypothetical protein